MSAPNPSIPEATRTAQVLRKAPEAFGPNGEYWTQGYKAKPQGPGPFEYPFCCVGTSFNRIAGIGNKDKDYAIRALVKAAGLTYIPDLPDWNDEPWRTFADVKAIFGAAIAKHEGQAK